MTRSAPLPPPGTLDAPAKAKDLRLLAAVGLRSVRGSMSAGRRSVRGMSVVLLGRYRPLRAAADRSCLLVSGVRSEGGGEEGEGGGSGTSCGADPSPWQPCCAAAVCYSDEHTSSPIIAQTKHRAGSNRVKHLPALAHKY